MATARSKVIKALQDNAGWMTARKVSEFCDDLSASYAGKVLYNMECAAIVESRSNPEGKRREYRLRESLSRLPRGTVKAFIEDNPGLTIDEIASGIPCRKQTVFEFVRNSIRDGRMTRTKNDSGEWCYTAPKFVDMPFGCANPLTMAFNQAIAKVRSGKQISCN